MKEKDGSGIPRIKQLSELPEPLTCEVYEIVIRDGEGTQWRLTSVGLVEELCDRGKPLFELPHDTVVDKVSGL